MENEIDFVITWVDGSDPKWLLERSKYTHDNSKIDESRYRDWDLLRYWFRAVELNAPWVHKIHFVTYGHIPEWLDITNPKLHIVEHKDFIDRRYLPTFNSCAIEMNLHNIPGLAERFVYFNDDMFINKMISTKTFFTSKGLPRDTLILKPIYPIEDGSCKIQNACMRVINRNFAKKDLDKKKLFSSKNGLYNITNAVFYLFPFIIGINSKHLPQAYRKSTIKEMLEKEPLTRKNTMSHKFRTSDDCSQWLFQYWQLASGDFAPCRANQKGCYHIHTVHDAKKASEDIIKSKNKLICINDNEETKDYKECGRIIKDAFSRKYSIKSSYEK